MNRKNVIKGIMTITSVVLALSVLLSDSIPTQAAGRAKKGKYAFKTEEVIVPLENVDREYRIAWISDLHLISDMSANDEISARYIDTALLRYNYGFLTSELIRSDVLWPQLIDYVNNNKFDAVILGGDMIDYCSSNNVGYFSYYYNQLNPFIPSMYIRSDHDYGTWYSDGALSGEKARGIHSVMVKDHNDSSSMAIEFEDFMIVGINESNDNMTGEELNWFRQKYDYAKATNKQIIIATHVPINSSLGTSMQQFSNAVWSRELYWGGSHYKPNEVTEEFLNMIYSNDTVVREVLAGHLHASWDGKISDKVNQHIFSPAYQGNVGVIHIVPLEK